jgi:ClpP class serine protease
MTWLQFLLLIGTILGAAKYMHTEFKEWTKEIREDVKIQTARTDRLYEMFVDLIKENRK